MHEQFNFAKKAELPNQLNPNNTDPKSIAQLQAVFTQDVILQHPSACMAAMEMMIHSRLFGTPAPLCVSAEISKTSLARLNL